MSEFFHGPHPLVMHLMTAAGASALADAVFRFTANEAMQTSRPTSVGRPRTTTRIPTSSEE